LKRVDVVKEVQRSCGEEEKGGRRTGDAAVEKESGCM
jgi:hypothetical protein